MTEHKCDLHELASTWVPSLPMIIEGADGEDGDDEVVFARGDVPVVRSSLRTGSLVVMRAGHEYGGHFRADAVAVFASRATYRNWGLLLVAQLLAESPHTVEIELTHPESEVKRLRIEPPTWSDGVVTMEPTSFTYWPSSRYRFPWDGARSDPPSFRLTDQEEMPASTDEAWAARDTVVGHGRGPALAWLAALLLDIGNPRGIGEEFRLESPLIGNGGVAAGSAEVTFWLPASDGWPRLRDDTFVR